MSYDTFAAAVGVELARWDGVRGQHRILRAIHAAANDPGGVEAERAAATERAGFAVADWHRALGEIARVETLMLEVLDALELTELAASIPRVSPVGVTAILAQTGDPTRYDLARTWVKHAGLCPRGNESGAFAGTTTISRRGRPALRTAAWPGQGNKVVLVTAGQLTGWGWPKVAGVIAEAEDGGVNQIEERPI